MSYFYDDEIDKSAIKAESARQRKLANALCPECNQRGFHLSGCPDDKTDEEKNED